MQDANTRAENARRNGALSKGPKTPEGKAISSRNATRHGLTATGTVVLQNENPAVWNQVLATHLAHYRPVDDIETELVEDIAFCRWRMRRFRSVDTALWELRMEDQSAEFERQYDTSDEPARLAFAFRTDANLHLASRYEGRLRRSYERAIRNLKEYRAGSGEWAPKEKTQNEPTPPSSATP
jgi:hypothetical protein